MITETGIITLATMGFAFLTAFLGICYKSKCTSFKCCCFDIKRDIKTELKEDMPMMLPNTPNTRQTSLDLNLNSKGI